MKKLFLLALLFCFSIQTFAQKENDPPNADEVARELSNPVGALASLTFHESLLNGEEYS